MSETGASEVLLVIRRPGNVAVMRHALARYDIAAVGVTNEQQLQAALERRATTRVALVDVSDFGGDVWRVCASLQHHQVPFIALSTTQDLELGGESLAYGAASVLQKPVAKSALMDLIRTLATRPDAGSGSA